MHLASAQRLLRPGLQAGISTVVRNAEQVCDGIRGSHTHTQVRAAGAGGLCVLISPGTHRGQDFL